jgi:monofunctional biosynthetic peptidoglycan transglycosylase
VSAAQGERGSGLRIWRWALRAIALSLALTTLLLVGLTLAYAVLPPLSTLMLSRHVMREPVDRRYVPLNQISPHLVRAVVASEDQRFCSHSGVDWEALREVIEEAEDDGPSRGASTITMQTAKNLFLWHGRSYVRKGLELPLALVLDLLWSKPRVMEVYLNIAEWGEGVFGAEAAAQRAFGKSAAALTPREAALLAAALPNPLKRPSARPTRFHAAAARRISARAEQMGAYVSCLK